MSLSIIVQCTCIMHNTGGVSDRQWHDSLSIPYLPQHTYLGFGQHGEERASLRPGPEERVDLEANHYSKEGFKWGV